MSLLCAMNARVISASQLQVVVCGRMQFLVTRRSAPLCSCRVLHSATATCCLHAAPSCVGQAGTLQLTKRPNVEHTGPSFSMYAASFPSLTRDLTFEFLPLCESAAHDRQGQGNSTVV